MGEPAGNRRLYPEGLPKTGPLIDDLPALLSSPSQPIAPGQIHLILGGARSGKSSRAEELVREAAGESGSVVYVATYATDANAIGTSVDSEMEERLTFHRARRPSGWTLVENRFDLETVFAEHAGKVILVDCLTMWLSWWSCHASQPSEETILKKLDSALRSVPVCGARLFLVSNELGLGLVPVGAENRSYRDLAGRANQLAARLSHAVEFMIAGLPLRLKQPSQFCITA